MDYYDGNTVTGLWNYAQHFAMSDNSYSDTFGPSTPGAINVTSGNTGGEICGPASLGSTCRSARPQLRAAPRRPGLVPGPGTGHQLQRFRPVLRRLLGYRGRQRDRRQDDPDGRAQRRRPAEQRRVSWGWFQGGFASPNYVSGNPSTDDLSAVCTGKSTNIAGASVTDYNVHHEPFQYYRSTSNPQAPAADLDCDDRPSGPGQPPVRPEGLLGIGRPPTTCRPCPYLKAPAYQDGHAGYSDPIDEQTFLAQTINHLQRLSSWKSTAVVILYDDTDGWYDHQMGPILTQSQTPLDTLSAPGQCGANPAKVPNGQQARCGVGMRQPLLVISPFSRHNFVDSALTMQCSVVRFIEDNWLGSERIGSGSNDAIAGTLDNMLQFRRPSDRPLFLDPSTGEPVGRPRPRRPRTRRPRKAPPLGRLSPTGVGCVASDIRTLRIQPRVGAVQGPSVVLSHSTARGRSRGSTLWPPSNSR